MTTENKIVESQNKTKDGALIPAGQFSTSKYGTEENFQVVSATGAWLTRLQLCTSNSDAVKRGKIGVAHYAAIRSKDDVIDLGTELDVLPISWRPKAMEIPADGNAPISFFNPKTPEFQDVAKRSEIQNSGCVFGPDFLVWVPSIKKFLSFHMNSKTARRESPNMMALLNKGRAARLKSKFIESGRYSWHGPVVIPCSTPFEMPEPETLAEEANKFNNPDDSQVELAETETEPARAR